MAFTQGSGQPWEWTFCKYCSDTKFDTLQEFKRHLSDHHCLKEGDSFICRYGYRGVCSSMSLNGVTEPEYLKHVTQFHASGTENATSSSNMSLVPSGFVTSKSNSGQRLNGSDTPTDKKKWTVYSGSQILPAVLNDPNRGKQKDFFTKLWGDTFVEKCDIPPPYYLPEITKAHFELYLRKIGKRHRKHERMKASIPAPTGHTQVLHSFPNLRVPSARNFDKLKYDVDTVPSIFLQSAFNLSNLETFNAVYNLEKNDRNDEDPDSHKSISAIMGHSGKILQEKLSHYLDTVEVQISHQVAHKSDAFFLAMRSHDALMEHMTDTIAVVKSLRENIHQLDKGLVQESLRLLKLKRARSNYMRVYQKLKLMATVHQTQPMIQVLLSTPDYVAALDLIQTSQEMLNQKLPGIHSFRLSGFISLMSMDRPNLTDVTEHLQPDIKVPLSHSSTASIVGKGNERIPISGVLVRAPIRHLGPQLLEMGRLIDKMLSTEFERYATADLNRPLGTDTSVLEGDKLVSIILGLLRQKKFDFIDAYKAEAFTTIKAVVKQSVIEVVASSEAAPSESDLSLTEQMQALTLTLPEWCRLFQQCTETLKRLVLRVKAAADIMRDAANASAGLSCSADDANQTRSGSPSPHVSVCEPPDIFLNAEEHNRVCSKLDELLCAVCDSAHERCAQLLTAQQTSKYTAERDGSAPNSSPSTGSASSTSSSGSGNTSFSTSNGTVSGNSAGWLVERASAAQVCLLSQIVEEFCTCCQQVCGRQSVILRTAFKMQANKFVVRFHQERRTKLDLILSNERWKQTEVPAEFQALVDRIHQSGEFGTPRLEPHSESEGQPPADKLRVGDDQFAVVGTVLILIRIVAEYCGCATDLPLCAAALCRYVAELLAFFNSRCCQLVLGAGAVQSAGLQTITTTNLALASRALQLLLWLIPKVRAHFAALLDSNNAAHNAVTQGGSGNVGGALTLVENAERDVCSHIEEIEAKVLTIMSSSLETQLSNWDARPPVPSQSFRNVTRHLSKLHKAVGTILPAIQIRELYRAVHVCFKDKLRETLAKNGVVNNGGPQHGVVTTELTFYLEALRSLHVLPDDEVSEQSLEDVWR